MDQDTRTRAAAEAASQTTGGFFQVNLPLAGILVDQVLARLGLQASYYGHAAAGLLHVRPVLDLHSADDLRKFRQVADEVSALVTQFKGSLAGEHGLGWTKRGLLALQWEPRAVEAHEQIKRALDPKDLLNPGKKLARYPAPSPARSD